MARLRSSSLITVTSLRFVVSGAVASAALRLVRGEGILVVPGCLTGESEERETWTAESLRAASSGGLIPGSIPAQWRPDETSAVHVSGQHHFREAEGVGPTQVGLMSAARMDEVGPRQTL